MCAADDRRPPGQVGEGGGPQDALGLQVDVVVERQGRSRFRRPAGLVHPAGEPAGAAEVALLDDLQPVAEPLGGVGEVRMVRHLAGALIDDVDRVEQLKHVGGVAQVAELARPELAAG